MCTRNAEQPMERKPIGSLLSRTSGAMRKACPRHALAIWMERACNG